MSNELKPCPFCGGEAVVGKQRVTKTRDAWMARCKSIVCIAAYTSYFPKRKDAIAAWNRRVNDDDN